MSLARMTGALCGALGILLGLVVLVGWAVHSPLLIHVSPDLPPMQPITAVSLAVGGLALLGIATSWPRWTFAGSPTTATMLGVTGLLAAAVGAAGGIGVIWGRGNVFALGNSSPMALPTAAGFLLLGTGAVAVALEMSQAGLRVPAWAPIGAGLFVATVRLGLLQAFSPKNQNGLSESLAVLGALFGVVAFSVFVHVALKAHLQSELLRRAEHAALQANEQLEQRIKERTRAMEAANAELRAEIAGRERVEEDLRQQKEILQTIFDHIPVMVAFVDQNRRLKLANREWERTLGYSFEEMKGQEADIIVQQNYPDPEERERAREFVHNSRAEWADFRTKVRDGRVVDTSWAILSLSDGTSIGIGQDISERKQAERDLRKQKEILQTIFDHIPVMVGLVDQNGQAMLVNREWERTLGWTREELESHNIDVVAENYPDPEYREQVRNFIRKRSGEWADFKTTVRDGRVIDTSWAMLHLSDGSGIGIGQDITKRKRAEEALRESEERFRQLAENIHDLFWIKTPDFKRVLYLSPIYESLSGHTPDERYQDQDYQPFLDRIVPEDRARMEEIVRQGAEKEFEIEFRIARPDGSVRWIRDRGFPIRDQAGQIYRIAGIANDITERKLAEEALRESEERFRQLAENINEVFWLRSPDLKRLLYVSPMYEKVCGRTCESLYESGPENVVHPEDRARVMETMERLAGNEFEVEYRIVAKDGRVRWLRDRGFPIRNQSGEVYRVGGVAEDITDRKESEDRLKASSEQLRALSASLQSAREQEATRIAHQIHDDMGGILTGLRWELEALEKMIQEPTDTWHLRVVMREKLAVMLSLTDNTINVVRRIASELRPSILDDLGLMEAIEWHTQQFEARTGIQCRCHCSSQSIVLGNQESTAVFRIVQEALTNVIRHAQANCVDVSMKAEDEMFILTVTDNGRGITQEEMLSRKSLGLLGMQERAHLIGGRVDIVGLKGTGTTLHVRVPFARAESAGAK